MENLKELSKQGSIKKVYTMVTVHNVDSIGKSVEEYHVVRNYKNGSRKIIGKPYKTREGVSRQVRHRNSCHLDMYGTEFIIRDRRMD